MNDAKKNGFITQHEMNIVKEALNVLAEKYNKVGNNFDIPPELRNIANMREQECYALLNTFATNGGVLHR